MTPATTIDLTVDATATALPPDTKVYMYVVGLVSSTTKTYYRLDASGIPRVMSAADNTNKAGTFPGMDSLPATASSVIARNYPQDWADYSLPVSLSQPTTIDLANINPTNCPGLGTGTAAFSGRVYISIGVPPLPFSPIGTPATGYTAPVAEGFPGSYTLFDWIEFSFDSMANFNGNTTQVDQFGFPLTLDGAPGGRLQGLLNQSRSAIIDAFGSSLSGPFGGGALQVPVPAGAEAAYPSDLDHLRVIAPKTITAPAAYEGELATYFDDAIGHWYGTWETAPLVTKDRATGYYTGVVPTSGPSQGILAFYKGEYPTLAELQASGSPVAFLLTGDQPTDPNKVISTWDIWQCANTLANNTNKDETIKTAQLNVGKMIAAAFNRGVMGNELDDTSCDPSTFYPAGVKSNRWCEMFHDFSANGLSYGFPYDDVCDQNPSISLTGTTSVSITVGKLS